MTDLTPITALLATYPRLSQADLSPVRRWIEEGADLERDILPVIRYWIGEKKDIYSLGFFAKYVRQKREESKWAAPVPDHVHAKNVAWHRKRNLLTLQVGQQDYEWLDKYEAIHGAVEA